MVGSVAVKALSGKQRLDAAALPWVCVARSVAESQDAAVRKLWCKIFTPEPVNWDTSNTAVSEREVDKITGPCRSTTDINPLQQF
jgi:hypothetical protein